MNIEGCDPLTLPMTQLLRGGCDNPWVRTMAAGKELYPIPVGQACHSAFVTGILTELRTKTMNLTQIAQNIATQPGVTMDDSAALRNLARTLTSQLHSWIPGHQKEAQEQELLHPCKLNLQN